MYGEARTIEIDLGTGRAVTVKLSGRAVTGAKALLRSAMVDGEVDVARLQMQSAILLPDLLRTGLVVGWRGFCGEAGGALPLQPDLLADLLIAEEIDCFVGTLLAEVLQTPAAQAAQDLGLPDPTESTPEPRSSTS